MVPGPNQAGLGSDSDSQGSSGEEVQLGQDDGTALLEEANDIVKSYVNKVSYIIFEYLLQKLLK